MKRLVVLVTVVAVGAVVGFSVSTGGAASELRFFIHDTHQAQLDLGDRTARGQATVTVLNATDANVVIRLN